MTTRLQWVEPLPPESTATRNIPVAPPNPPPVPRCVAGYMMDDDGTVVAVALQKKHCPPPMCAAWAVSGQVLAPTGQPYHLRPTSLRDTIVCHNEAVARAEAALLAQRLLAARQAEVAA